jgi:hypothetical protein
MSNLPLAEFFKYPPELFRLTSTLCTDNRGEGVEVTCEGGTLWDVAPVMRVDDSCEVTVTRGEGMSASLTRAGESDGGGFEGELLVAPTEAVSWAVEAELEGDVERAVGETVGAGSADIVLLDSLKGCHE